MSAPKTTSNRPGLPWFMVHSDVWSHPKMAALPDSAFRLCVNSWAYATQYGTEGKIPAAALKVLGGTKRTAETLVDAGLWHQNGDGWHIHEYEQHQEGAIRAEERKARDRARHSSKASASDEETTP